MLSIRGYPLHDLIRHIRFIDLPPLLWDGELPSPDDPHSWDDTLRGFLRNSMDRMVESTGGPDRDPTGAFASVLNPEMRSVQPEVDPISTERAGLIWSRIAAWILNFNGGGMPGEAEDVKSLPVLLLSAVGGEPSSPQIGKSMEHLFILMAEHPADPSTRAVRSAMAEGRSLSGAIVEAWNVFHDQGAGRMLVECMESFRAIGESDREPGKWMLQRLRAQGRLAGFARDPGHTEDPRVTHLREITEVLEQYVETETWFRRCRLIEDTLLKEEGRSCRAEFYLAPVFSLMGLSEPWFLPVLACMRSVGWIAHALEQNRLSPDVEGPLTYAGPVDQPVPELT